MKSYKEKAVQAVKWSSVTIVLGRCLGIAFSIIKYRLLNPEDFGVMALVTAVFSIFRMIQTMGFGAVLVQREEIDDVLISSVFWLTVIISSFVSVFLILFSGMISRFYGEHLLIYFVPIAAAQFLFSSFLVIQDSLFARGLRFKEKGLIALFAAVAGNIIVIVLAFLDFGPWSLLYGLIATTLVNFLINLKYLKWWPSLGFNWRQLKPSFGFGLSITLRKILGQIIIAAPPLVIGKLMGTEILGIFTFAGRITKMLVGQVDALLSQVLLPVFSRIQNDKKRLVKGYLKVNHYCFLAIMPMVAGYLLVGGDFISLVYGNKWLPGLLISQILVISFCLESIYSRGSSLITAFGRPELLLRIELHMFLPFIIALLGSAYYGIVPLVIVLAVGKFLTCVLVQMILKRLIGLNHIEFLLSILKPLFASIFMCCTLYAAKQILSDQVFKGQMLVSMIVIGGISYSVSLFLLEKDELIQTGKLLFSRK